MGLINNWRVVEEFEHRMAAYCGARYGVAVDTCTAALFLCFKRSGAKTIELPARTYLGVACAAIHAGAKILLTDRRWTGAYIIWVDNRVAIVDSACSMQRGMFGVGDTRCLSFQYRKHLKIGRGGMILTSNYHDAEWFRKARFCGRAEHNGHPEFVGWHAYMEPERAARGLVLMDSLPDHNPDLVFEYPDLREYEALSK